MLESADDANMHGLKIDTKVPPSDMRKRTEIAGRREHSGPIPQCFKELKMKNLRMLFLASVICMSAGVAFGQAGGGMGPGAGQGRMGAGPGASAPGMGMGMGSGGGRGAARWGSDVTPGWALMNAQERKEHQDRMRAMKTYDECKAYRDQHHEQMMARAKERGVKTLAQPRRDACNGLKP